VEVEQLAVLMEVLQCFSVLVDALRQWCTYREFSVMDLCLVNFFPWLILRLILCGADAVEVEEEEAEAPPEKEEEDEGSQ